MSLTNFRKHILQNLIFNGYIFLFLYVDTPLDAWDWTVIVIVYMYKVSFIIFPQHVSVNQFNEDEPANTHD